MKKQFAKLEQVDHNEPITAENYYEFLYHLQTALLLALLELGTLNTMQHRYAEDALTQQRQNYAKNILKNGDT